MGNDSMAQLDSLDSSATLSATAATRFTSVLAGRHSDERNHCTW